MTDSYTPGTEDIRESYQVSGDGSDFKHRFFERGEDFDAWLRKVKAEAWDEGRLDGLYDGRAANYVSLTDRPNPYRD